MTDEREGRASPHDDEADEPLGPMTPDEETDLGDTPEAHDEVSPHDLPKDHPGPSGGRGARGRRGRDDARQHLRLVSVARRRRARALYSITEESSPRGARPAERR